MAASSAHAQDAPAATAPAVPAETLSNPALAERLARAAQDTLRAAGAGEPAWRASAALLRAATRLAPTEPRFARLLSEALARLGDDKATIEALTAYRALAPADEGAQAHQIDLFLGGMETSDAKVNYLTAVSRTTEVSPPVRSHAALRLADVLEDRSEMTASDEALAEALKLDPLNLPALEMSYERMPVDVPPERRVASLLAMLRANPAQAQLASLLARELAAVGLVKASLQWYGTAFSLYRASGAPAAPQEAIEYAAEAYISGDPNLAEKLISPLVEAQPDNIDAWFVRLIAGRAVGDKDVADRIRKSTAIALTNRLAAIRKEAGDTAATTQPIDAATEAQWPDPSALLEKVRASNNPELTEDLAATALSAAWFKLYFEEKADDAQPWIGVMRTLLVENSQTVARLEGWTFLLQNKPDEARVKLSAVAESDPLAALGLIRLAGKDPEAKAAADAEGRKLLAKHGWGLTGATLAEALAFRGIKPQPSDASAAVTTELAKFPSAYLRILDYPSAFYSVRLDPLRITHQYGEPILLKVTVQNVSEHDLTIGDDGIIRPDLWVDAQFRGIASDPFPAVAFDRLAGPIVLPAKKSMSQVIRGGQGPLAEQLAANPTSSHQITFTVTTNPTSADGAGSVMPGPAGQKVSTARLVERRGTPNNPAGIAQRANEVMAGSSAAEKIQQLELLSAYAQRLKESPDASDDSARSVLGLLDVIGRGSADDDPTVRAWAMYCGSWHGTPEDRAAGIEAMSGDPAWPVRLIAVRLAQMSGLGREAVTRLAESDADETVKEYAAAVSAMPVAATQPATQAATAPAAP